MSLIATTIAKSCFAWILFYVCIGASQAGRDVISGFVSNFAKDTKGATPLVMLTYPVLIAASVCALLGVRNSRRYSLCPPKLYRRRVGRLRSFFQRVIANHGDGNYDLYAVVFLLIPLIMYMSFGIHRHATSFGVSLTALFFGQESLDEETTIDLNMEVANVFGMMAVVALGLFLIPASKHGPIMKVFGWSHAMAIRLHIWAGRLIVICAIVHGGSYYYTWKYRLGEDFRTFLMPPRECWVGQEDFTPTCNNGEYFCDCYDLFLCFTGTITELLLLVILITSSNWVRRKAYHVFLTCHLLVGPMFFLVIIIHYNSAILYMSPSILYYLATAIPPYLERRRSIGVPVVSVEVIGVTNKYLSITIEATRDTVKACRPGMYTNLSVPSISSTPHPFTINRVPGNDDRLRIILHVVGPFTRKLASLLEAEAGIPTIHLDGLHGPVNRLHQLRRHDTSILVAGGVGVTPFLSLIGAAVDTIDSDGKMLSQNISTRMKHLQMHWICRDASLIEYVRQEYLDHVNARATPTCETEIHIHQTNPSSETSIKRLVFPRETAQVCEPFRLSRFLPSKRLLSNLGSFLALSIIIWPSLAIMWYCYTHLQSKDHFKGRGIVMLLIVPYTVTISLLLGRMVPYRWFGKASSPMDECKMLDESDHSYEELLPLSQSSSAGRVAQSINDDDNDESQYHVRTVSHSGRPDLETIVEAIVDARWPAIFSCGPSSLSQSLKVIVNEKSQTRNAVEPTRSSPLVTIYDEAFLL